MSRFKLYVLCVIVGIPAVSSIAINSTSSALTPLGENATFTCSDFQSHFPTFVIGKHPRLTSLDDEDILRERKIFQEDEEDRISLKVLATESNNNTEIRCRDLVIPSPTFSVALQVTVIGAPLRPALTSTVISATELRLKWKEPFTWPDHEVMRYDVSQQVASGIPSNFSTTLLSHPYFSSDGTIMDRCQTVTFRVSAVSDLGSSEHSVIHTGLPARIGTFGEIIPVIRFTKNGDPEVNITLQPPALCDYQTEVLVVELVDEKGELLSTMMHAYSGRPQQLQVSYAMQLGPNINYSLMLAVYTVAGNASESIVFDTQQPKSLSSLTPVIGGVSGGGVLVSLIIVIVIAVYCSCRSKARSLAVRSAGDATDRQRESSYDYVDDYHVVPSARKNQYLTNTHSSSLPPPRPELPSQPRPESPYQDMNSAKADPSLLQPKTFGLVHNPQPLAASSSPQHPASGDTPQLPNNDMAVTAGGSVVYRSRTPGGSMVYCTAGSMTIEPEYTAMRSPGRNTPRSSITLPENVLPYNGQPSGEYIFTEC